MTGRTATSPNLELNRSKVSGLCSGASLSCSVERRSVEPESPVSKNPIADEPGRRDEHRFHLHPARGLRSPASAGWQGMFRAKCACVIAPISRDRSTDFSQRPDLHVLVDENGVAVRIGHYKARRPATTFVRLVGPALIRSPTAIFRGQKDYFHFRRPGLRRAPSR